MTIQDDSDFEDKKELLLKLLELREEERVEIDQKYLTVDSIISRMSILQNLNLLTNMRILAIGDSDLAGTSISIFGNPNEVVVVDIDRRISEILFEANMEHNLPVRFVYHDMRLKLIEILFHQYNVILMEPPPTEAGIEVFISRAIQTIERGYEDNVFVSINQENREFFQKYIDTINIVIMDEYEDVNIYTDGSKSTLFRIRIPLDAVPTIKGHWINPFYSQEVDLDVYEYRCMCHEIIKVGNGMEFPSIEELRLKGHSCGHKDLFSFHSKIPLL